MVWAVKIRLGYKSVLDIDEELRSKVKTKSVQDIVEYAYPRGTRALLEDGLRKVQSSRVDKDAIYQIVQDLPEGYLKYAGSSSRSQKLKPNLC